MAASMIGIMAADMRLSTMEPNKFDDQGQRDCSLSKTASSLEPQKQRTSEELIKAQTEDICMILVC